MSVGECEGIWMEYGSSVSVGNSVSVSKYK